MTPDPDGDRLALRVPGSTARQAEIIANAPSELTMLSVFERRDRTVGVAGGLGPISKVPQRETEGQRDKARRV